MSKTPIDSLIEAIEANILELRGNLRENAPAARPSLRAAESLEGQVFVESVGTTVTMHRGTSEFFYTPEALTMRDVAVGYQSHDRAMLFDRLASQFRGGERVLVLGAGGDTQPLEAFDSAGLETLATDHSEDTVSALRRRCGTPAFACDLAYLDRVLQEPVQYMFANSTLGYLDPAKTKAVVENIVMRMTGGGIFTFDLAPHPHYFMMAEATDLQTIANESGANPNLLLKFIERFGPEKGIAAMALHSFHRAMAVNLATVSVLVRLFEDEGCECSTGYFGPGGSTEAGNVPTLILRVVKSHRPLLNAIVGEVSYADPDRMLAKIGGKPQLMILYLDRGLGLALARALSLDADWRSAPWRVARYIGESLPTEEALSSVKTEVLAELDTSGFAARLSEYVDEQRPFHPPPQIPRHVLVDQMLHKSVLTGEMDALPDRIDEKIDQLYAEAKQQEADRQKREKETRSRLVARKRQKAASKARKKNGKRK